MGYIGRDKYQVLNQLRIRLQEHRGSNSGLDSMLEMYIGLRESSEKGDNCAYAQKAKFLLHKYDLEEIDRLVDEYVSLRENGLLAAQVEIPDPEQEDDEE